ncbi:hypothetical protein [Sporisorium scitamineum]|uniref:Uncharacterized protein n=1 Tax=Sporisorium scitamineum TaxID=49012 RepID=A0A0F7RYD5_9BASI|nr:hypothetical protein [Sporisorium scitamineum]
MGDRRFLDNANRMIDFQYKSGLVPQSRQDFDRHTYAYSGGRNRASTAEIDDTPTLDMTAPSTAQSQAKGSKRAPSPPGPATVGRDEQCGASSPPTPTRKRTTSAAMAAGVLDRRMIRKQRWMYTALELMANLRGDFNFFLLLVADKAQGIPV